MKKIILTTIILVLNIISYAQQKPASKIANITLPSELNPLTSEQAKSQYTKSFKHFPHLDNGDKTYISDGIIVDIKDDENLSGSKLTLEMHKKMTEDFNHGYKNILQSKITTLNGIAFFVFETEKDGEYDLSFTSDFKNDKIVNCSVKYKKQDEERAKKIFNKILKSFSYK